MQQFPFDSGDGRESVSVGTAMATHLHSFGRCTANSVHHARSARREYRTMPPRCISGPRQTGASCRVQCDGDLCSRPMCAGTAVNGAL